MAVDIFQLPGKAAGGQQKRAERQTAAPWAAQGSLHAAALPVELCTVSSYRGGSRSVTRSPPAVVADALRRTCKAFNQRRPEVGGWVDG